MKLNFGKSRNSAGFTATDLSELLRKSLLLEQMIRRKDVSEAVEEYLTDLRIENKTPKTLRFYRQNLEPFVRTDIPRELSAIGPEHIKQFFRSEESGHPYRTHAEYRALRAFFNWAIVQNYILRNPVLSLKAPKLPEKLIPTFTVDEIRAMLAECSTKTLIGRRDRAIILVLFDTGIRLKELIGLTLQDIDIDHGFLRVMGKGNKERIVRISNRTLKELWAYLKLHGGKSQKLWLSEERQALTDSGVAQLLRRLGKKVGIENKRCSPHTFRHTFAVNFLRSGGNIRDLMSLGGWQSLEMVMRYTKALTQEDALRSHQLYSPVDRLL